MAILVVSIIELVPNNSADDDVIDDVVGAGIDGDGQTERKKQEILDYMFFFFFF